MYGMGGLQSGAAVFTVERSGAKNKKKAVVSRLIVTNTAVSLTVL
jgi:hypothetical protein